MAPHNQAEDLRPEVLHTEDGILKIREQAEQEVRRVNETLEQRTRELNQALVVMQATLEATTDGILVTADEGTVTDFNEKYVHLWNIPRETLERGRAWEVWNFVSQHFAEPQRFAARIQEILASAEESFDLLELKDGRIFERFSRVLIIDGQNGGRVWSLRDVTERHLSDLAARRLAAIVSSSDDGIIGKDLNSIVTSWNFGAERIFGYTAEEMIGQSIMRLIPPTRQSEEREILARIRAGQRMDHFETVRVAKDGRELYVSVTISPIMDSSGHVVGASKVVRDITREKNAEKALKHALQQAEEANRERILVLESEREARSQAERASRMKDEFLATLSHELRTPLNAVLGWTTILQMGKVEPEEIRQGLETIERNARAQAQIIEDLLDMSRIISGKIRLDVEQIDLAAILNAAVDTVASAARAKNVQLRSVVDPFAGAISGDPNRLQQVFWNLLTNAIKFTPRSGSVQVVLERIDSHVQVRVIDTGEGITPDFMPYVFDRFQQADASITRRHGGLGLGLAIVKQLVELHGGKVGCESAGIGQGATFSIELPLLAVYSHQDEEIRSLPATPRDRLPLPDVSLQGVCVLVVDDEPDARVLVKRLLEMAGATVSMAASRRGSDGTHRCPPPECPGLRYRNANGGRLFTHSAIARTGGGANRFASRRPHRLRPLGGSNPSHSFGLSESFGQAGRARGIAGRREQPGRREVRSDPNAP